jgi:REP element-mobilizing transposase RayT
VRPAALVERLALQGVSARSASRPTQQSSLPGHLQWFYFLIVNDPRQRHLPHDIPFWVDSSREIYFITINCRERPHNQLTLPAVAEKLFETVRHRQEQFLWWPYLFLLMPDHLHALLSFPPSDKPIRLVISKWKEWTAKTADVHWQDDFFEHRLRHDESRRQKADYILENPVRKGLVSRAEDWPFVFFGDGERPKFED